MRQSHAVLLVLVFSFATGALTKAKSAESLVAGLGANTHLMNADYVSNSYFPNNDIFSSVIVPAFKSIGFRFARDG